MKFLHSFRASEMCLLSKDHEWTRCVHFDYAPAGFGIKKLISEDHFVPNSQEIKTVLRVSSTFWCLYGQHKALDWLSACQKEISNILHLADYPYVWFIYLFLSNCRDHLFFKNVLLTLSVKLCVLTEFPALGHICNFKSITIK